MTLSTKCTTLSMIMYLAMWFTLKIIIVTSWKGDTTNLHIRVIKVTMATLSRSYLATETVRMPLWSQGSNKTFHDGFITTLATWGKFLIVTLSTICLAIFLMKSFRTKVFATESTEEMLRMPSFVQSFHTTLKDKSE